MKKAIEVKELTHRYDTAEALCSVSLEVPGGSLFGLIGPNGAGKTTLFKILLGILPPTSGEALLLGEEITGAWKREIRSRIGYLPENIVFYNHLTGLETLAFYARIKGVAVDEVAELFNRVGLAPRDKDKEVGHYSKGMRQRLGLAQALLGKPEILFLDEPTTGLDPEGIGRFYELVAQERDRGVTILLSSHILREIQDRVDRLAIISEGKILAQGTVPELRRELGLRPAFYLIVNGGREEVEAVVRESGGEEIHYKGHKLTFRCHREKKRDLLKKLLQLDEKVKDLELHEPTLEEVFFQYHGRQP